MAIVAREPNQSAARGMWDVTRPNQQRNAIYGERWPTPYVPASQYYIRTCTGYSTTITDGTSTNSGTANTGYSTWGYSASWNNADAMGFSHQKSSGNVGTYKLNKISIGSGTSVWDGQWGPINWRAKIYTGLGTATNTIIYDSNLQQTAQGAIHSGANFASINFTGIGSYSFFMLDLPDATNNADPLPALSWNTAYTIAFAYQDSTGNGYSFTNRTYSDTITLNDGSVVTQNHFNTSSSMSDNAPFGASNGTNGTGGGGYGQFPVLGYLM